MLLLCLGLQRYVGVDIAQNSLVKFVGRLQESRGRLDLRKVTHLIHADIGTASLGKDELPVHTWLTNNSDGAVSSKWNNEIPLKPNDIFDIASCQFAMHYMFQSSTKAHHFFEEISSRLNPGGIFIATTIDCKVIAEHLTQLVYGKSTLAPSRVGNENNSMNSKDIFEAMQKEYDKQHQHNNNNEKIIEIKNELGLVILSITFSNEMCERLIGAPASKRANGHSKNEDPYGIQYAFTLQDDAKSSAVNAPEWIVPQGQPLHELAAAHDMKVLQVTNFQEMIHNLLYVDFDSESHWYK